MHVRKYDKQIKQLHEAGKTFREIRDELGCALSTISKALDPDHAEKRNQRNREYVKRNPLLNKCANFNTVGQDKGNVTPKDVLDKFGLSPTCCLTGDPIDWYKPNEYSLDHIVPRYLQGKSTIENCQVVLKDANQMKGKLLTEELLKMCEKVLVKHGYMVSQPVKNIVTEAESNRSSSCTG